MSNEADKYNEQAKRLSKLAAKERNKQNTQSCGWGQNTGYPAVSRSSSQSSN